MKKLYFFFSLCLALIGVTSASAQITSTSELANDKCYTVKNSRSSWVCNADGLNTIAKLAIAEDATDANQQFAFLSNDEGETFYLYSVGQKAFINNDGTLSQTAAFPLYFKNGEQEGTFVAYFDGDHHINIGGSNQMTVDWWSTPDAGNSNFYIEAAEFDATELLALLPAPVVDPAIKNISELSNNMLYTVVQKNHNQGVTSWAIAEGGAEFVSSAQIEGVVAGQEDDTKQQFAFITNNELTYIYHAAEKKFVNKDRSLSDTPVDAVSFEAGAFKNTFVVKFDNEHYVNVGGSKQMEINGWNAADGGNSCSIIPVEEFDPTEVLKLFVTPTTIENAGGVNGAISTTAKTLEITFSAPIAKVNTVAFQSMFGEFPPMVEGTDYSFNDKVLTINVPTEYLANAANVDPEYRVLILALNVEDVNGNIVTYSNSTHYPQEAAEQMGMSFLQYNVVPPTTIENAGGSNGNITTATSTLEITFSAPIAKVNTVAFQAMFGEFPPMVEGTDYSFYDNVLTINIPTEYLANAANVPAEYRTLILALNVEDVNGNIVTYSNSTHYPQEAAEQMGMSFLQYNVIPATTVTAITPECGFLENGLESTVTLTFSADIKAVEYGTIRTQLTGFRGYIMSENDYVIEGNKLTINVPAEFIENQSAMQIRMNVIDANDMYVTYAFDPEYGYDGAIILEWTAPVKADLFNMVSSDPAAGEVEKLDVINVTFADAFETVIGGFDTSKTVAVLNAAGDTVTTAAMEVVQEDGWNTNTAKFTLATPVTEAGEYTFVIPAATVYNEMFYEWAEDFGVEQMGALYNAEVRIAYTIVAPVVPTTIESAGGSNGNITTTTSTLEITFSAPIAKVNTVAFQAMFGEFPPMVEGTDYSFYDNVLTINIPTEYLANAANVPAEYRTLILALNVEDVNGNIVTYSNSTHYPQEAAEQMGMSFLQYNVIPATTVTAITPECGFLENGLESTVTLTFSADIKAVEYGTIRTQLTGFRGYIMSENDYVIEGNKLTINVPAEFIENQSAMQIRMNVIDANDMYVTYAFDPEYGYDGAIILEWTAPVKADLFNMVSSDPAAGEVEKLDVINVTFADAFETVIGGFDTSKTVAVLNAAGDTVTTAAMEVVQEDGWNTNTAKFTLATPVTEAGEYTFVIPAATVYNEMFYEWAEDFGVEQMGALYNPEVRIAYTISIVNGIESVTVNKKSGVYTLDGRKVNGGKLVKGVYVIDGKKVYVK